jgi:hypothetical protein
MKRDQQKGLLIQVPEDLHKKLKLYAYINNISMTSIALELLEEKMSKVKMKDLKSELLAE